MFAGVVENANQPTFYVDPQNIVWEEYKNKKVVSTRERLHI